MKKLIVLALTLALIAVTAAGCAEISAAAEENYVAIDMQEAGVQFLVDGNDEVTAFSATTVEGEELLIDEDYTGENVEDAIEDVVQNGVELGYIDPDAEETDPNAIMLTAQHNNSGRNAEWKEQMMNYIDNTLADNGIWAIVLEAGDIEQVATLAETYDITEARVRIILALQTVDPELTFEEAAAMEPQEIMTLMKSMKPIQARIAEMEARAAEIQTEIAGLNAETDAEEIAALNAEAEQIQTSLQAMEQVKATIQSARLERQAAHQEAVQAWKNEKQTRSANINGKRNGGKYQYSNQIKSAKKSELGECLNQDTSEEG